MGLYAAVTVHDGTVQDWASLDGEAWIPTTRSPMKGEEGEVARLLDEAKNPPMVEGSSTAPMGFGAGAPRQLLIVLGAVFWRPGVDPEPAIADGVLAD